MKGERGHGRPARATSEGGGLAGESSRGAQRGPADAEGAEEEGQELEERGHHTGRMPRGGGSGEFP